MDKTRTTITFNDDLIIEIKIIAAKQKKSMNKVIETAVKEYIEKFKKEGDKNNE